MCRWQSHSYKKSMGIVDGKQQLQERFASGYEFSVKSTNDNRCKTVVNTGW